MFTTLRQKNTIGPKKSTASDFLLQKADHYLQPVQQQLLIHLDKRLVATFFDLFVSILLFRNSKMALLLSELGGFICGHDHAPAGTKRISNLLRSKNWGLPYWMNSSLKRPDNASTSLGKRASELYCCGMIVGSKSLNLGF